MEHQPSTLSNQPRPSKRFVIVSWALVAAWAFLIFFMSSNTGTGLNTGLGIFSSIYRAMQAVQEQLLGPGVDALSSIAHFCEYTMFGALLANALRCHMPLRRACLIAIACASLYGVSDEVHQLFVPERMCDRWIGWWILRAARWVPGSRTRCCEKEMPALSKSARVAPQRRGACFPMGDFVADVLTLCFASRKLGVVARESASFVTTDSRTSAVPSSILLSSGRPMLTMSARRVFVMLLYERMRLTFSPSTGENLL